MIKAKPFNGVQGVNSVSKRDELDTNQGVISSAVVNIPLSFHAATDEWREQRTGRILDNVVVVDKQDIKGVSCSHTEVLGKELLNLNNKKGHCERY